jgi:hypothetical protein
MSPFEILFEAMKKIAELKPMELSVWDESDCFYQAQEIATDALKQLEARDER